ncbi:MAG: PilN domain-containing protein [Solirubrobacterales bacterium]
MKAVNLIPSEERRGAPVGAGRSGGAAYIVLGAFAVLAVLVLLYGMARHKVSDSKSKLASIAVQTQRAQESASVLTPYTSFIALREQRMQAVEAVVDSRFDWAHAFHELGRVLPRDASISSLEGAVGSTTGGSAASAPAAATSSATTASAPQATSATPPGTVPTMTLTGCASSQSEVALTLQRLRLMDGVSAVSLKSSSKTSKTGGAGVSSSANCTAQSAAFGVSITFEPLPTPAAKSGSGTELTASTGGGK